MTTAIVTDVVCRLCAGVGKLKWTKRSKMNGSVSTTMRVCRRCHGAGKEPTIH